METVEKAEKNHSKEEEKINILLNNERCDQCGMLFTSSESLRIHKEKFCIGVFDSGFNQTTSPINSKYIENMNSQRNHNDIDNINNDVEIIGKIIQNKSLDNISKEYDDFLETNSINPKNNNDIINDQDGLIRNRIQRTPINNNDEITIYNRKNQNEMISSSLANSELRRPSNRNDENQINYSPKDSTKNSNGIEELSKNYENMNSMTQRSDQISIYSHTRKIGTPNDRITLIEPISIRTKDEKKSRSENEFENIHTMLDDVKKFKSKKSIQNSLQDLEDHLITDTMQEKQFIDNIGKKSNSENRRVKKNLHDDTYKKLLKDVNKFKYLNFKIKFKFSMTI